MADNKSDSGALLRNHGGGHAPVSYLELFFDLVFVFAITQLSHVLHDNLTWRGLLEESVLFLAVWWAWMYTTWATNWANPERLPIRVLLLVLMLLSLAMAVAIPHAVTTDAALFAASYIAIQLGRSVCMIAVFAREKPDNARNFARISVWFVVSGGFWAIGVLRGEDERLAWWLIALGIEYGGPFAFFRVPGLGRSTAANWDISGSHMAERCALFIIIALGEGIVVTGSELSGQPLDRGRVSAFVLAFLASVLMWWLYFDLGADRSARAIQQDAQPGRFARDAYTYLHMPIVGGIVIGAVSDALVLEHWAEPASHKLMLTLCGGAGLFLGGLSAFKRLSSPSRTPPLSHGVAMVLFTLLGAWGWFRPTGALALAGASVAILALAVLWEWVSFHGGWKARFFAQVGRARV